MSRRRFSIVREAGSALALVALCCLTLLLPLHQAASLQRDLVAAGFDAGVSPICSAYATPDSDDRQVPTALKCPAAGVSQHEFVALLPESEGIAAPLSEAFGWTPVDVALPRPVHPDPVGQPRAPPRILLG